MRKPTTQNEKGDARTDSANVFFARDDDDDAFPMFNYGGVFLVFSRPNRKAETFFLSGVQRKERTNEKRKKNWMIFPLLLLHKKKAERERERERGRRKEGACTPVVVVVVRSNNTSSS